MIRWWFLIAAVLLFAAWTHGAGGVLLTDQNAALLTDAGGDLLTR
jgi:hypothetical protein